MSTLERIECYLGAFESGSLRGFDAAGDRADLERRSDILAKLGAQTETGNEGHLPAIAQ